MRSAYQIGHQVGFEIARYRRTDILLSREELRPIAAMAIKLLVERGYAYLEPCEESQEGFVDGWLDWLYSYVPRSILEASLSWGDPVTS